MDEIPPYRKYPPMAILFFCFFLWNFFVALVLIFKNSLLGIPFVPAHLFLHILSALIFLIIGIGFKKERLWVSLLAVCYFLGSLFFSFVYFPFRYFSAYQFLIEKYHLLWDFVPTAYRFFLLQETVCLHVAIACVMVYFFGKKYLKAKYHEKQNKKSVHNGDLEKPSVWALWSVWSNAGGLLFPFFSGIVAIVLGVVAFDKAKPSINRRERKWAWLGIILGLIQMVGFEGIMVWKVMEMNRATSGAFQTISQEIVRSVKKKHYVYGETLLRKCLKEADKQKSYCYYHLGVISMEKGNYNEALWDFQEAIIYNPENYDAYQNRAVVFRRMGQYKESVQACLEILKKFPDAAKTYASLGLAYEAMGQFSKAAQAYLKAIHLSPLWVFPKQKLAYCLQHINDREKILSFLGILEKDDPLLAKRIEHQLKLWDRYVAW